MFNDVVYSMTSVNYALGNMPTLTFYVEGDSKRYAMNQNGVQPGVDNFSESETGFFNYTILKSELELIGADVNVDNTSDITLNYKTNLYGFVQNKEKTMNWNFWSQVDLAGAAVAATLFGAIIDAVAVYQLLAAYLLISW